MAEEGEVQTNIQADTGNDAEIIRLQQLIQAAKERSASAHTNNDPTLQKICKKDWANYPELEQFM